MTYEQFLRGGYDGEEIFVVLDKLITAGLGNRRPQTSITRQEFEAAMQIQPDVRPEHWGERCYAEPARGLDVPKPEWRHRQRVRERDTVFPSWSVPVGHIRVRREIARCE